MIYFSYQQRNRGKMRGNIIICIRYNLRDNQNFSSHWATAVQRKGSLLLPHLLYLGLNIPAVHYYHKKSAQLSKFLIFIAQLTKVWQPILSRLTLLVLTIMMGKLLKNPVLRRDQKKGWGISRKKWGSNSYHVTAISRGTDG